MREAVLGVVIGLAAVSHAAGQPAGDVWNQAPGGAAMAAKPPVGGGLQWQILQIPNSPPAIVVVDPVRQVVAVYQIDAASGVITLKSVRRIVYDLQLEAFNATEPVPAAVRQMTE